MKIQTPEQYEAKKKRFRKKKADRKVRNKDCQGVRFYSEDGSLWIRYYGTDQFSPPKMDNEKRFAKLDDCWPLLQVKTDAL
jgi:hypothetical protein